MPPVGNLWQHCAHAGAPPDHLPVRVTHTARTPDVHIIIAARGGFRAKSRCTGLGPRERSQLTEAMLSDMLEAMSGVSDVSSIRLVTPTRRLASLARLKGVKVIHQRGAGLNGGFEQAMKSIERENAAGRIVLLPADLPLLDPGELNASIELLHHHQIVIAPTNDGGTGALLFHSRTPIQPVFGPDSFRQHSTQAAAAGLSVAVADVASLTRDIDRMEDFPHVMASDRAAITRGYLSSLADTSQPQPSSAPAGVAPVENLP